MKRREFLATSAVAAILPRAARGQQRQKIKRIAIVYGAGKIADMRDLPLSRTFFEELSRNGFVEGENLVVDLYSGEGRIEHYPHLAREVISAHPDLIFVPSGIPVVLHFKSMTTEIPVVTISGDPIANGLVLSLARPGGNVTGATIDGGYDLYAKRLELLAEAIPKLSRVGYLATQPNWESPNSSVKVVRGAAERAGVSLIGILLGTVVDEAAYRRVFDSIEQFHVGGLLVSQEAEHFTYRVTLAELVAKSRIPAVYPFREIVDAGGLMSYSADLPEVFRHVASQTAEVLKGANPGEIPVYQATKFELAINMKAARALSLELPATLVATADEVIEWEADFRLESKSVGAPEMPEEAFDFSYRTMCLGSFEKPSLDEYKAAVQELISVLINEHVGHVERQVTRRLRISSRRLAALARAVDTVAKAPRGLFGSMVLMAVHS